MIFNYTHPNKNIEKLINEIYRDNEQFFVDLTNRFLQEEFARLLGLPRPCYEIVLKEI
jgi:hypothetical protein